MHYLFPLCIPTTTKLDGNIVKYENVTDVKPLLIKYYSFFLKIYSRTDISNTNTR